MILPESNYCKGCPTYRDELTGLYCPDIENNKAGRCPCSNCVIKSMCEAVCNEFKIFARLVNWK